MDTEELREYTKLGRNSAMKLGEEVGAKIKIGRKYKRKVSMPSR